MIRAPGHTPTTPMPFCGAPATAATAVPWKSVTGSLVSDCTLPPVANSGWVRSTCESTMASSGLVPVTAGGVRSGLAMKSRQFWPTSISGSCTACGRATRSGSENPYAPATRRSPANARARERATT